MGKDHLQVTRDGVSSDLTRHRLLVKGANGSVDITQNGIITHAFSAWYDDRLLNPQ